MSYLNKIWFRILIAIIGGAIIEECYYAISGISLNPGIIWVLALPIYFILSFIVMYKQWRDS